MLMILNVNSYKIRYTLPNGWRHTGFEPCIRYDKLHRENGPAIIDNIGNECWYQHGKLHRKEGPAIILTDGYQAWYYYGERHRNIPLSLESPTSVHGDGTKYYY